LHGLIDLHSHILPGIDDGAPDLEVALEMARAAVDEGVTTMVATPHINFDYPTPPDDMTSAVGHLNVALARAGIALAVLPGAEVAVTKIDSLSGDDLKAVGLGGGTTLLIECPYTTSVPFFEQQVDDLQQSGFRVLLAHPERSPLFRGKAGRLERLVESGALVAVNAGSLRGLLGENSRESAYEFVAAGLVHAIASDAHDVERRPPGLRSAFAEADEELPGLADQIGFYTRDAPAAIISGRRLPARPAPPQRRAKKKKRLFGRR
jgi:protein-tyrosine phosphatase